MLHLSFQHSVVSMSWFQTISSTIIAISQMTLSWRSQSRLYIYPFNTPLFSFCGIEQFQ